MKRTILYFVTLITLIAQPLYGNPEKIKEANELYANGNYSQAAETYENIIATNGIAPELYYNLGNAYYKLNEIGKSILNYERALKLRPGYKNAAINLEFAQARVVDNVVPVPAFFIKRWLSDLMKMLSSNQWFWIAAIAFVMALTFILLFVYGATYFIRRFSFYTASTMATIVVISLIFSGIRKNQLLHHNAAIIMAGSVTVKSSPDKSGTNLFQLHEGTKVEVVSKFGDWTEIVLSNGNPGWVSNNTIEEI